MVLRFIGYGPRHACVAINTVVKQTLCPRPTLTTPRKNVNRILQQMRSGTPSWFVLLPKMWRPHNLPPFLRNRPDDLRHQARVQS